MKLHGLNDSIIWSRFKKGDSLALELIYERYAEKLYQYGLKFTTDNLLVEDCIHDLFAELIRNCRRLGNTDNILYYLLASLRRKLQRKLQREQRFSKSEDFEGLQFDVTWSVENEIIEDEISQHKTNMLQAALKKLTPRQKEAIYLRYSKELDYKMVAETMEISIESCRNLISGAIKIMKDSITAKIISLSGFFLLSFTGPF